MSLSDAMLAIADALDAEAIDGLQDEGEEYTHEKISRKVMKQFAQQIRMACKVVEGQNETQFTLPIAQDRHFIEIERAKLRAAKEERRADLTEKVEDRSVVIEGGPENGTYILIPGEAPNGAKFPVMGGVCVLEGNRLVFNVDETEKYEKRIIAG